MIRKLSADLRKAAAAPGDGDEHDNQLWDTDGDDILSGGAGNDTVYVTRGVDVANGGAGNDHLFIDYADADTAILATPARIWAGDSRTVALAEFERITLSTGAFGDDVNLILHRGDNHVDSGDGDDMVQLGGGANTASGAGGRDLIVGAGGTDWLDGGEGGDTLFGDSDHRIEVSTRPTGAGTFTFELPSLGNLATFRINVATSGITVGEEVELVVNGVSIGLLNPGAPNEGGGGLFAIDPKVIVPVDGRYTAVLRHRAGGDGSFDVHYAEGEYVTASDDNLSGGAERDSLSGGAGNDHLDGGTAADVLYGGDGDDIYVVDDVGDMIFEWENAGTDEIRTSVPDYQIDRFANVEKLTATGTSGQVLTGNAGANTLTGNLGDDTLIGGLGNDTMAGGAGNDVYQVDSILDVVVEAAGEGVDEVRTSAGSRTDFAQMFVLAANVENLTGTALGGQGVYANALDNVVKMGTGGDLVVLHDGGVDTVDGGGGDDFLHYGAALTAEDRSDGGAGYDTIGLLGTYQLSFGAESMRNIEKLAVYSSGDSNAPNSYHLIAHDANLAAGKTMMVVGLSLGEWESLRFDGGAETDGSFNIRGGRYVDYLSGGAGNDQLYGNRGADVLRGGGGRDSFEYYDVLESAGQGRDIISDFEAGDRINLIGIDADGSAGAGNGRFAWIGTGAFSGKAGELRSISVEPGVWLVEGDVDGNGTADLSIMVNTAADYTLSAADFWL